MKQQYALQQQIAGATHEEAQNFHETVDTIKDLRDKIANFDDFFRPIRNYFYWEQALFRHSRLLGVAFGLRRA